MNTPITDAAAFSMPVADCPGGMIRKIEVVEVEVARKLEQRIDELETALGQWLPTECPFPPSVYYPSWQAAKSLLDKPL